MKGIATNGRIHLLVLAGAGLLCLPTLSMAKVTGQCAQCHTMHNSQGGSPMAVDASGATQSAPNNVLLVKGCVACHTGSNDGTNNIPYVNSTTAPTYGADGTTGNTLAGGNFYWVASSGGATDAAGHNVATDSLAGADAALGNTPPGGTALSSQLTCAGVTGCHGDRTATSDFAAISGAHHGNDGTIDGSTVATSYRFLDGIVGLEDSDWEYQPTATAHNQYYGVDRTDDTTNPAGTISSLCGQCHNDFHNGAGNVAGSTWGSPWVRHPTDFDMGNTATGSEYRNYGGAGVNAYVVSAPVASTDYSAVKSSVTFADDTIVTCVSCHRAHGTPNADLLRWDYSLVDAGSGNTGGCFECHTTKN
ncbi:cytochrome c3 family protein [Desulfolithobacter sp.]